MQQPDCTWDVIMQTIKGGDSSSNSGSVSVGVDRIIVMVDGGRHGVNNVGRIRTARDCCGHGGARHLLKAADVFVTCCGA